MLTKLHCATTASNLLILLLPAILTALLFGLLSYLWLTQLRKGWTITLSQLLGRNILDYKPISQAYRLGILPCKITVQLWVLWNFVSSIVFV